MSDDEIRNVVIATSDPEKALFIIVKELMFFDDIELHYTEKYAPITEYVLRMLKKLGLKEEERGRKDVTNTKCAFNAGGFCNNKKIGQRSRCTETIRNHCDHYKQKFNNKITVNFISISKVGQIRSLE